jgi:membrane protein implicated in regulation of membrane protease activity
MSSAFVVSAVSTGVVVIAVAAAVVLVVLFVTLSMRGRQKRGARRIEARRDVDEARGRAAQAERDRDIAREGGENLGPQR